MKKNFFLILLIFFLLLSKEVLSNEDVIIKKIVEGLDLPAHLSKNEFISKNSIFVLEHKLGQIVEIQNYDEDPKINQKPILNMRSLISESDSLEQGFTGFTFSFDNTSLLNKRKNINKIKKKFFFIFCV